MKYEVVEPDWENTAFFFAKALKDHSFERGLASPVISFIEQIRYLERTDPEKVERLMERLK